MRRVLARAQQDGAQAVADVTKIDKARAEVLYLFDFYSSLARDTTVSYDAEIERFREKMCELESARDEAITRIEKSATVKSVLTEKLENKPGRKGGRLSRKTRQPRPDNGGGGHEVLTSPGFAISAITERSTEVHPGHAAPAKRGPLLSRMLILASVILFVVGGFAVYRAFIPADSAKKVESATPVSQDTGGKDAGDTKYQLVGKHGIVDIILVNKGADLKALGDKLNRDYSSRSRVQVYVFNELESAMYLDRTYDLDVSKLTPGQLAAEYAKYYPRWVATYFHDDNNGLNQVEIYSDPLHSKSETIPLPALKSQGN